MSGHHTGSTMWGLYQFRLCFHFLAVPIPKTHKEEVVVVGAVTAKGPSMSVIRGIIKMAVLYTCMNMIGWY